MKIKSKLVVSARICPGCDSLFAILDNPTVFKCPTCGYVMRYFVTQELSITREVAQ
jgi:predicted RNA-binding Zn-ribbon protein involved in translation (DUF1610 family)